MKLRFLSAEKNQGESFSASSMNDKSRFVLIPRLTAA
jgi:hypothetical protein